MLPGVPLLSFIIWLPVFAGLACLFIGDKSPRAGRWVAMVATLTTFALSLPLWADFDRSTAAMQFVERLPWIGAINAWYHLGIDGFSLPLIVLTTFITPLVVVAGWRVIEDRPAQYMAAFLMLEGLMIGVFAALDGMLFYVFWEAMLIPMFLIIGIWGGARRVYATIKFFLYTFLGSVLMLVALVYLYLKTGTYDLQDFYAVQLTHTEQLCIFLAFFAAFAVKIPMVPVHTWLPDAHVEAPTGGSVILAAIMLKLGGYGFIRFALPITPDAAAELDWLVISLSLVAVAYIGLVALVQQDMKKLIAYSSIAHMGFVTLGLFLTWGIFRNTGSLEGAGTAINGAMIQMVSHGLISGAMFLCVGVMYDRLHTREISAYGGVINTMPKFGAFMVLFAMANAGLPGTSGFVGEFLVILASYKANFWFAFVAALTLIFGAAYTLWLVKRVIFGEVGNDSVGAMKDLSPREFSVLGILAVAVLALGVYPKPLTDVMAPSVQLLVQQMTTTKLPTSLSPMENAE
jgi:NADH-quinone oxidoreductase subunit M